MKKASPKITSDEVADLCTKALTKQELVKTLMDEHGCRKSKAYVLVDRAIQAKKVMRLSDSKKLIKV